MSSKMRNYPPFGGKKVHFFKFVTGKGIQFSFSLLSEDLFRHGLIMGLLEGMVYRHEKIYVMKLVVVCL
ncbi:MAG: hypothetical protein D3903_04410 [Candidatus Electrothrix sp. GM3_4]|nr:hypothetical protein [Candidatus Electrothrix sp. GM3_4]